MSSSVILDLPYLSGDVDRHGTERLYVRKSGKRVRIREKIGTPEFTAAYAAAVKILSEKTAPKPKAEPSGPKKDSLRALAVMYFESAEFKQLDAKSRSTRQQVLESCFADPLRAASPERMGDCPFKLLSTEKIRWLRDIKAHENLLGAANNRLKYLSSMCGWAVENDHLKSNPCRDVRKIKYASSGFHAWTIEEVQQYEARHPIGTKARLALALLLYTGCRRGDLVRLGRQHLKDGGLKFIPRKTSYKRKRFSEKPILPQLKAVIDASTLGQMTFLVTEYGKPFTDKGFGQWFRTRCNQAGLPHCAAHGLRKAGAILAAENGATDRQLMALFDWETADQATIYTENANRKRLAAEAARLLGSDRKEG